MKPISQKFARTDTAKGKEMIYRTDFENLLRDIFQADGKVTQINHDSTNDNGNKPDFVISKNNVPILYIEAKDIGVSLDKVEKSEQMKRYFGYTNLILTDYVEFRFYRNGERYGEPVKIANYDLNFKTIQSIETSFDLLKRTTLDFAFSKKEPIKKGSHLAKIMGGKAERIRENVLAMLKSKNESSQEISKIEKVIRENLISDLDDLKFSDMYAQTLIYGLFAARYHDKTIETFSRQEARDLVPKTNPFLADFFEHIAGNRFPDRLRFIVDEMCEVFEHADVHKLMHDFYKKQNLFGEITETKDPVIHFYEDFLKEYDPKKKMEMGVFYTPKPVVKFIVNAVDEILKTEFGLVKGLADNSKIKRKVKIEDAKGKLIDHEQEYHRVQILDVATGTGTFLNETIYKIYESFKGQEGQWQSYVKEHLLPRLHGFELMMASYTIAHLKLGMTLEDTGVKDINERLGVYLTNTLEEPKKSRYGDDSLFQTLGIQETITREGIEASKVKSEYPIMCVIGNPPYSISSSNKGEWILEQIEEYKKNLNEKKINIDDDYIKFIRFAQHIIDKNYEGVVAYISNNSFVSGITHRKMRESLLKSFDKIYILDLHGNSRLKETSPDGSRDQNVFDIMQGVSINIFIKTNKSEKQNKLGEVFHLDLYGERNKKFEFLSKESITNAPFVKLRYSDPYFFFVPKDFRQGDLYEQGFLITDLFNVYSAGIKTKVDSLATDFDGETLSRRVEDILQNKYSLDEIIKKFNLSKKTTWEYNKVLLIPGFDSGKIVKIDYRPFDQRWVYYDHNFLSRSRKKVMENALYDNLVFSFIHQGKNKGVEVLIGKNVVCEDYITNHTFSAPLYIYNENKEKISNLNVEIVSKIKAKVEDLELGNIIDYAYAILHSSIYREKYKEFLKIDFPRIPYPTDKEKFWKLVKLGEKLRKLHLEEDTESENFITTFPVTGNNLVEKVTYKQGNVFINDAQYFGGVPEVAWNFYIGGYQPAQKWLKDRKGRVLNSDDINHYQKIIKILVETDRLMKEINSIDFL
jgi:predicted helicase